MQRRHDFAVPAEKRVGCRGQAMRQAKAPCECLRTCLPGLAKRNGALWRAHEHEFPLPEGLHARRVGRGLMAEAPGLHINHVAGRGQGAARRHGRIHRVAGSRRQHAVGRRLRGHPGGVAARHLVHQHGMRRIVAVKAMHGAEQMGESLNVAALLNGGARHHRRKPHHLRRRGGAQGADQCFEPRHDGLKSRAAPVDTRHTRSDQQAVAQKRQLKRRIDGHV